MDLVEPVVHRQRLTWRNSLRLGPQLLLTGRMKKAVEPSEIVLLPPNPISLLSLQVPVRPDKYVR